MRKNFLKFGLLGSNIEHSLSPLIHNTVFDRDGINARYEIIDIPRDDLTENMFYEFIRDYNGLNITSPFKTQVAEYLNGNLDYIASNTHSVNTVKIDPGSHPVGYNTDVKGFQRGILDILAAQTFFPSRLILLGGGGVARSVIYSFLEHYQRYGLKEIPVMIVIMRNPGKNVGLVNLIAGMPHQGLRTRLQFVEWYEEEILNSIKSGGLFVNATPIGSGKLKDKSVFTFEDKGLKPSTGLSVADLVYNPSETKFMKSAKGFGNTVIGGLGMLVYQALGSLEIWLDQRVSEKDIFKKLEKHGYTWLK
ncbi:shikimate dehydrogenase [bacterium]|nr:shikimate dehydrogenase [bacterium]MBU1025755.1 shikimate dehydrogenase [bacterium]